MHRETHAVERIGWLRASILGANDGIVSTASLIAGVAAAGATQSSVLITGVAGLVAGAMSMAAGEYVSVSSQRDAEEADIETEKRELATDPAFELEELTQIYQQRGLDRPLAEQVARQLTDVETRIAILRTKATSLKFDLPAAVLNFIAQNVSKNIRRLEGALIKVASYANLTGKPIDLPTAEMLLQDVLIEQAQNLLTIEVIQKRVADHYQIRHSDMTSKRRPANIAIPRQIAMYLCRQLTKHSLQEIGDSFGGRDHGTVIHACKSVDNMLEQDTAVRGAIEYLKGQLAR